MGSVQSIFNNDCDTNKAADACNADSKCQWGKDVQEQAMAGGKIEVVDKCDANVPMQIRNFGCGSGRLMKMFYEIDGRSKRADAAKTKAAKATAATERVAFA